MKVEPFRQEPGGFPVAGIEHEYPFTCNKNKLERVVLLRRKK